MSDATAPDSCCAATIGPPKPRLAWRATDPLVPVASWVLLRLLRRISGKLGDVGSPKVDTVLKPEVPDSRKRDKGHSAGMLGQDVSLLSRSFRVFQAEVCSTSFGRFQWVCRAKCPLSNPSASFFAPCPRPSGLSGKLWASSLRFLFFAFPCLRSTPAPDSPVSSSVAPLLVPLLRAALSVSAGLPGPQRAHPSRPQSVVRRAAKLPDLPAHTFSSFLK